MKGIIYPVISRQAELPFYLTGIGIRSPEAHVVRPLGLSSHQLLYSADGSGTLIAEGKQYNMKKGAMFYIAPQIPHEYYPSESGWATSWIVFKGAYASEMLAAMGLSRFAYSDSCSSESCGRIMERIFSAASDPLNSGEKESVLVYEYILNAKKLLLSSESEKSSNDNAVDTAIIYIDKNYMNDIRLESLAELSGISVQHFCRLFRKKTAMRPMEYLARKRIAEAKALLDNTDMLIDDISKAVGYNDGSYFGAVFRRTEGISPGEYRRQKGSVVL